MKDIHNIPPCSENLLSAFLMQRNDMISLRNVSKRSAPIELTLSIDLQRAQIFQYSLQMVAVLFQLTVK